MWKTPLVPNYLLLVGTVFYKTCLIQMLRRVGDKSLTTTGGVYTRQQTKTKTPRPVTTYCKIIVYATHEVHRCTFGSCSCAEYATIDCIRNARENINLQNKFLESYTECLFEHVRHQYGWILQE